MDITKYNQVLALDDFVHEVQRCDFCAVDQEMTGVDVPGTTPPFGASPEEVYYAKRIAVEAYNAFQMGIALFTKLENGTYEVRPYNFYLLNTTGDLRLGLSAISFLAANNMNFQTWLTSGLTFCDESGEKAFEEKSSVQFAEESEQRMVDAFVAAVDEWFATEEEPLSKEVACTTDFARRLKAFVERRSDYQIAVNYDGRPYLAQKMKFTLKKLDGENWAAEKEKRALQQQRERAQVLGFRQFWKVLVESRKPIVGHNFMQDVMFMFHMHQRPLPENYDEFKKQLQSCLPEIYDTKTIAGKLTDSQAFPVTHLGAVYQECRRRAGLSFETFSTKYHLPPGFYNYNDQAVKLQNKAHEAAYDAYMTGVAFSIMRDLYTDVTAASKNVISAYGSVYYMCVDTPDTLTNRSTFILDAAVPCSSEDIESLFFVTETSVATVANSDKIDFRKLSYQISGLQRHEGTKQFTSFCVCMRVAATAEELHARIQSLREKPLTEDQNVNLELLPHLTFRAL